MLSRQDLHYEGIVEARMASSRLPGKMLMVIDGKPSLQILTERLQRVPGLSGITVATTENASDDPLEDLCNKLKIGCFRGSVEDVLQRVLGAARTSGADVIVEITGDCTFLDPDIVEESIDAYKKNDVDFVANCVERPHYPAGMDARIFATELLAEADKLTDNLDDREHVSLYFWEHPERYKLLFVKPPPEYAHPEIFIALDEQEDLDMMRRIYEILYPQNPLFSLKDILALLKDKPQIYEMSKSLYRKGVHG